jgi:hypothetical protein
MSDPAEMARDLRAHLALSEALLLIVEREGQMFRTPGPVSNFEYAQSRKNLLPQLDQSLARLKRHRIQWQRLDPETRKQNPEIASLLRLNQDLAMKIVVLDRENEQSLLRRGLLPANHLPPANRQRPHYVADLYRRNSGQ